MKTNEKKQFKRVVVYDSGLKQWLLATLNGMWAATIIWVLWFEGINGGQYVAILMAMGWFGFLHYVANKNKEVYYEEVSS